MASQRCSGILNMLVSETFGAYDGRIHNAISVYVSQSEISKSTCICWYQDRRSIEFGIGVDRCGSFSLFSARHSLFIIWTDVKRSEKIPGAPTWRWGERIWLTGPSGLHRNSPQGLNIGSIRVFDQIRDLEIPINLRPPLLDIRSSEIRLRKLKLSLRDKRFANHKAPLYCHLAATASVGLGHSGLWRHGFFAL